MISQAFRKTLRDLFERKDRRTRHLPQALLSIDQLESRMLLACTATESEGTLFVTGDEQDNVVGVRVTDTIGESTAQVRCDDEVYAFTGVQAVNIQSFGGNDTVSSIIQWDIDNDGVFDLMTNTGNGDDIVRQRWNMGGSGPDINSTLNTGPGNDAVSWEWDLDDDGVFESVQFATNLGAGNDVFSGQASLASHETVDPGVFRLRVDGQGGQDKLGLTVTDDNVPAKTNALSPGIDLTMLGGSGRDFISMGIMFIPVLGLRANVDGGGGDDTIRYSFEGVVDGQLRTRLDGGPGNDIVDAVFRIDPSSTGNVLGMVDGGDGDDMLRLLALDSRPTGSRYVIDGGDGFDTCVSTDNVETYDCDLERKRPGRA